MANYISLYSGSSGNCSVIEENGKFIMVDIGKSAKLTNLALKSLNLDVKNLQGVLISHEHKDHVGGLRVFLKNLDVPVFSNQNSLDYMISTDLVPKHIKVQTLDTVGFNLADFYIDNFKTPHDSLGCCGFKIHTNTGSSMALATDLGCVTDEIFKHLSGHNLVVLESNYDEALLRNSEYPYIIKSRIASDNGHLSNFQSSSTCVNLIKEGTRNIRFCHLSDNNNTPSIALAQYQVLANQNGITENDGVNLSLNKRHEISNPISF